MRKTFLLAVTVVAALLVVGMPGEARAGGPGTTPETKNNRVNFAGGISVGSSGAVPTGPITAMLPWTATIDFTSSYSGVQFSSAITVSGAAVNDTCTVSPPAAAAALKAKWGCVVTAANTIKIWFEAGDRTVGQVALSSGTPSTATATVVASSICTCTPVGGTAAIAAAGCATGVSSTTLTLTGPNTVTTTMTYDCYAPVDPASGAFEGVVIKH